VVLTVLRSLAVPAAALSLASAAFAADGVAYRVKDLRTEPTGSAYFAANLAQLPDAALLLGGLPNTGGEPWVSDGTPAGTRLLRDLAPGSLDSSRWALGSAGGFAYFIAWTPATGVELWRSDGTQQGTVEVADVRPGRESSEPRALGVLDDVLLFAADDGEHGRQVWRTDGTAAGTWRVSELAGGVCSGLTGERARHTTFKEQVWLGADNGLTGCELFATDGTAPGTRLVADLAPGSGSSYPQDLYAASGGLYFSAMDAAHGHELWFTDGSTSGTRLVADYVPGPDGSYPEPIGAVGGGFAFTAYSETLGYEHPHWTDGRNGVIRLAEAVTLPGGLEVGGRLVFFAGESRHGREPWVTDGTPAGTRLLVDLHPGPDSSVWGSSVARGSLGAYFIAYDALWNGALYRTDGTPAGTVRIGATNLGESIVGFAEVGGRQLFQFYWWAYCGPHTECDYWESWVSDGTEGGTRPLWPEPVEWSSSSPRALTPRPGGLVFAARSDLGLPPPNDGYSIAHATDGTEAGTRALTTSGGELLGSGQAAGPLPDGAVLLSGATTEVGATLWRTDGDRVSIVREPGGAGGGPEGAYNLARIGDLVFFSARSAAAGEGPWRSDGTAAGTLGLVDGAAGWASDPANFTWFSGRVWFGAENYEIGRELWESDGTVAGTRAHDLTAGEEGTLSSQSSDEIVPLAPDGEGLVLRANDDLLAWAPGEPGATLLKTWLRSLWDETVLTAFEGRVYFVDADNEGGCELWATDGTAAGTLRVAPIGFGWKQYSTWDPCPPRPTAFAGRLFFTACEAAFGCELWISDGTEAGTGLFADVEPGPLSFLPRNLTPIGDRLYFSGCTEAKGCEPWVTDGTLAGTRPLGDVAPGVLSSEPDQFTLSEGLVYFSADDGTGVELWAYPLLIFGDGFESGDTSRWSP